MCGRVALFSPPSRLAKLLDAVLAADLDPETITPSWNLGPQRFLLGVTGERDHRVLDRYRWGLIPRWASSPAVAARTVNARAETIALKPSFRDAYATNPVALPVDGFFEWEVLPGRTKQPHYFFRRDGEPMVLAGIFEHWRDPASPDAPVQTTCTIITSEPGPDIDGLHDRMPVILSLEDVDEWLDPAHVTPAQRHHLLRPAPAGTLAHHPVTTRVGSVRNDGPALIDATERTSLF